jgi:CcmD family protein
MQNFGSLFAAYIAVWAIFFIYDFTIARRIARVERELAQVKQQLHHQ